MTVLELLDQLLLGPLSLLFETIYGLSYQILDNAGAAILPLSLAVNFLLLPFYLRADAIQREEQELQKRMAPGVEHIKKCYRGDERYMMLQTFYRQNRYKPISALRSALPLLLQIPFFLAAYRFLSQAPQLLSASFGPLDDLSKPDGLLKMGGFSLNLLPILMTGINILSCEVYARDSAWKDKLRLYAMALLFLVILYTSPSGLVLYWTLNNLFSLIKNLISTSKNKTLLLCVSLSALGLAFLGFAIAARQAGPLRRLLLLLIGLGMQLPGLLQLFGKGLSLRRTDGSGGKAEPSVFFSGCVFLAILTGLLIPSSVISSSPEEFVVILDYQSPLIYLLYSLAAAAGMFVLWSGLFYYLADNRSKGLMEAGVWVLCGVFLADYMLFGRDLGNLSAELKYDIDFSFSARQSLLNLSVLLLLGAALFLLWKKKRLFVKAVYPILILTVLGMSAYNIWTVRAALPGIKSIAEQRNEKASFSLSTEGKNVIVFMLDRGIGSYVPYLMQENPDLLRQFDGFTWYPNTLSYGTRTNTASPALFGGYEYTPEELNKRSEELLEDKQNEALRIMPVLFRDAGYSVTVCDPPYAGYRWVPDLSIFDGYEGIRAYNTESGQFNPDSQSPASKKLLWKRNLFCYSLMKVSPLRLQHFLYQDGTYFGEFSKVYSLERMQTTGGVSLSEGVTEAFMDSYSALRALPEMTTISREEENTFLMIENGVPHNIILLKEPEYEPALAVDNRQYDAEHADRFTCSGRVMTVETAYQMSHYQCNMAAFLQLGRWFDYLRENGVYDNTRIVIVADHGWSLGQFPELLFGAPAHEGTIYNPQDIMLYNPLLMVKDFGSTCFTVDERFMTNADTPLLAFKGLLEDPHNPFTGKAMDDRAKHEAEHHVFYTDAWGVTENNGTTFLPGKWYSLSGSDIFDRDKWEYLGTGTFPEGAAK